MSLLFDENLSPRLVQLIIEFWPGSLHVRDLGLMRASDAQVIDAAIDRGLAIVTKNSDFNDLVIVRQRASKVIWIRLGNCSTDQQALRMIHHSHEINYFLNDPQTLVLVIQ